MSSDLDFEVTIKEKRLHAFEQGAENTNNLLIRATASSSSEDAQFMQDIQYAIAQECY